MVTTRPPKTIVKPTALGPVANTNTKLLIYGLFQKGRVLAQDGVKWLTLQWGRVLMNAETVFFHDGLRDRMAASMGPRSHERGNATVVPPPPEPHAPLQWGRVLMNAETPRVRLTRRADERASMGPRSHERGNGPSIFRGLF